MVAKTLKSNVPPTFKSLLNGYKAKNEYFLVVFSAFSIHSCIYLLIYYNLSFDEEFFKIIRISGLH